MKIDVYMELLKEEMKCGGWLSVLREVLFFDEIKNFREDIKRIIEFEKIILFKNFLKFL